MGYEGYYEASNLGRVRSVRRYRKHGKGMAWMGGSELRQTVHSSGYCQVGLSKDGVSKNHLVHCLVALAFIGERPAGLEVCHGDGDRENNKSSNLRYGTKLENAADKALHGTNNDGDTNPMASLTAEQAVGIYKRCKAGESQLAISEEMGISAITVNHIATGKTWSSVTGAVWRRSHKVITPKIVRGIAELQASGCTLDQIAEQLGISKPSAFRHSKGKSKMRSDALCS